MDNNIELFIPERIKAEVMHYVRQASPDECSGLGRITWDVNGLATVTHVYLLDQVNSGVTTDLDATEVAKLQYTSKDDEGALNWWWHSHVDMDVMWSGTDMATMEQFGKKGYLLSTVFNKRNEMRTAYYQGSTGFLPHVFVDGVPTECGYMSSSDELKAWTENFKAKDQRPVAPKHSYYKGAGINWGNYDQCFPGSEADYKAKKGSHKQKVKAITEKKKRGRPPKNKKPSLLGDTFTVNDENCMVKLDQKLNMIEQEAWIELVAEQRQCNEFLISHTMLYNFCKAYDFKYEVAVQETLMGSDYRTMGA